MVNREILYSIMPLYGDAALLVIKGASLREAIERAFDCKLQHVANVHLDIEEDRAHNDTVTFYAVESALGMRQDNYSVLCSATVITYYADESRAKFDVASVQNPCPLLKTEVKT